MFAKSGIRTHACYCTLNPKSNALTTRPSGLPHTNTIYFNIYTFTKSRTQDLTRTNIIHKHTNIKNLKNPNYYLQTDFSRDFWKIKTFCFSPRTMAQKRLLLNDKWGGMCAWLMVFKSNHWDRTKWMITSNVIICSWLFKHYPLLYFGLNEEHFHCFLSRCMMVPKRTGVFLLFFCCFFSCFFFLLWVV